MPKVACSVSNCTYWADDNHCNADMIMIEIDKHAKESFEEEFADENFRKHQDKAKSSSSTCCLTFKSKH